MTRAGCGLGVFLGATISLGEKARCINQATGNRRQPNNRQYERDHGLDPMHGPIDTMPGRVGQSWNRKWSHKMSNVSLSPLKTNDSRWVEGMANSVLYQSWQPDRRARSDSTLPGSHHGDAVDARRHIPADSGPSPEAGNSLGIKAVAVHARRLPRLIEKFGCACPHGRRLFVVPMKRKQTKPKSLQKEEMD